MDEFELIRRFFRQPTEGRGVLVGIGDDGAVLAPAPGRNLVAVVDTLIGGVHFPHDLPAKDVGYRALAVNVSDVAAMGGTPRWMTLALTLVEAEESWLAGFAAGLFEAAQEFGVALVGGDTTRGKEIVISVQVLGDVHPGAVLTRAGARPGDRIYVTGTVGDAAAGLELLQGAAALQEGDDNDYLIQRFSRPVARVALGERIASIATAAIDVSDGLGTDLLKLLESSNVAGSIDLMRLPLSGSLKRRFKPERMVNFALDGGDDYELCFTIRAADHDQLQQHAAQVGVPVTHIGEVTAGAGLTCIAENEVHPYEDRGYRHF